MLTHGLVEEPTMVRKMDAVGRQYSVLAKLKSEGIDVDPESLGGPLVRGPTEVIYKLLTLPPHLRNDWL